MTSRETSRIESVSLVLFSFQGAARLSRVDSWIRPVNLSTGGSREISFDLERRVAPGDKLILTVERVNGPSATREVNFLDLAYNAAAATTDVKPPDIQVGRTSAPFADDSGPTLCSNAFRRAMTLAQQGDKLSVTSFSCDQEDRSFSFTFGGKALSR